MTEKPRISGLTDADDLRRVNRVLKTISKCGRALVHAVEEGALLQDVCRVLVEDGGYVFAWFGIPEGDARPTAWSDTVRGRGPTGTAIRTGRPATSRNLLTDPAFAPWRQESVARGFRSLLALPLLSEGRVFGALSIYSAETDAFDERETGLLSEFSDDLAFGIQALRARRQRLDVEQALASSQAKLVMAMDMARLGYWEFDFATGLFAFDEHIFALLHTTSAREHGPLMSVDAYARKFVAPDEAVVVADEIARARATTDPHYSRQFEHRVQRADGTAGWVYVSFSIVKDEGGRTIKASGISQDITERKLAEDARAISDDRFRSAMHHSPIGMALVYPDDRWMEVNPAFCEIVGYTRDEMLAMAFPEITHPDDVDAGLLYRRKMLNHEIETYQLEKRYLHKDGRTVWVQVNASLVRDEEQRPQYFVTQIQDVTERRRAAADLLALNRRYARHTAALTILARSSVTRPDDLPAVLRGVTAVVARTLEVARVGIWRLGDTGTSMHCDDLFEWPASHVSGMEVCSDEYPELFQSLLGANVVAAHDAHHDERSPAGARAYLGSNGVTSVLSAPILEQGATVGVLSCEHVGPGRRWTADEQTFVFSVANLVSALVGQVERRHLEDQLRQAQKLEALGQLAGGIAHDFNNILTIILGKAMPIAHDARVPGDVRDAAAVVARSGDRAAALTRQLLAFSRRQTIQPRVVDLNAVVADFARMLPRIVGEDVSMRFLYGASPAHVQADAGMLDQVLLNLAVNARDAMPRGGQLTVETSQVELDEAAAARNVAARAGMFACLLVRDTGAGIGADDLPHIFEPFFTTKDVGKGTGLGLATTYGIVQQHDGWIEVDSEVSRGTVFRIFLPLTTAVPDLPELPDVSSASGSAPRGSETILVVEDEDAVRELVLEVLVGCGYTVLEASSGRQALDVWRSHGASIDLLLTDVVMPGGMNGFELADRLRLETPGLRVIFTSGYSADVQHAGQPLRQGVNYISKPYTLPELAQVVRRSLDAGDPIAP